MSTYECLGSFDVGALFSLVETGLTSATSMYGAKKEAEARIANAQSATELAAARNELAIIEAQIAEYEVKKSLINKDNISQTVGTIAVGAGVIVFAMYMISRKRK